MNLNIESAPCVRLAMTAPGDRGIAHTALLLAATAAGTTVLTGVPLTPETEEALELCRALGAEARVHRPAPAPQGTCPASAIVAVEGTGAAPVFPAGGFPAPLSLRSALMLPALFAEAPFEVAVGGHAREERETLAAWNQFLDRSGGPARVRQGAAGWCVDPFPAGLARPAPDAPGGTFPRDLADALLVAAAVSRGDSAVRGDGLLDGHTPHLLERFGITPAWRDDGLVFEGERPLRSASLAVPGDPGCAAYWLVAGACLPGSEVILSNVGLRPSRAGLIRVLLRMGARITEDIVSPPGGPPVGSLMVRGLHGLKGIVMDRDEYRAAREDLPAVLIAAAYADGVTEVDTGEDAAGAPGVTRLLETLRAHGVAARRMMSGRLEIRGSGGRPLAGGAEVDCAGDPVTAMTAAVLGLLSEGGARLRNAHGINAHDPLFTDRLRETAHTSAPCLT